MLTRITADGPVSGFVDDDDNETLSSNKGSGREVDLMDLAGHSYGITSDPLTQFAVIFSALIHDAEHPGVPNTQLVKEETPEAKKYQKSVAEQNSIHKAWDLLMTDEFQSLRQCIYTTEDEMRRFRQLVINVVLATDICDKDLGAERKARWAVAFADESPVNSTPAIDMDRKATIVIERKYRIVVFIEEVVQECIISPISYSSFSIYRLDSSFGCLPYHATLANLFALE